MKKIALVHYAYPPNIGGVEILMREHARIFTKLGYEVKIVTGSGGEDDSPIQVSVLPEFSSLKNINPALQESINKHEKNGTYEQFVNTIEELCTAEFSDQDVVIIHNMCTVSRNLPFIEGFKRYHEKHANQKVIIYVHDHMYIGEEKIHYPQDINPLEKELITSPLPNVTYVAISHTFANLLSQVMNIPTERLQVVPDGINIKSFLEINDSIWSLISKQNLLTKFPIILSPVNIVERKNLEYAVRVVGELKKHYPDICYIITGKTSKHKDTTGYFEKIQQLVKEQDIEPNTLYIGDLIKRSMSDKEIHDLYTIADAVFYFSKSENFGLPLLEAGLSRTPLFTSELNVFKEIADDLITYVDTSNTPPSQVASQIADFLQKDTITQMNRKIRTAYDLRSIIEKYLVPLL